MRLGVPRILCVLLLAASCGRPAPPPTPPAEGLLGRVAVRGDGFVRVRAERLAALGARDAARLEVRRRGATVPVIREGTGGDLVFLAADTAGPHTAYAVYEVWTGGGEPVAGRAPAPGGAEPGALLAPTARRTLAPDRVHGAVGAAEPAVYDHDLPTWFLAAIAPRGGVSLGLDPSGAAPESAQTLEVEVVGTHGGEVALAASWGGRDLGVARASSAAGGARLAWTVGPEAVPAEETALVLTDVSPPPPPASPQDVSEGRGTLWVDGVTLAGPVAPEVGDRLLVLDVGGGGSLRLTGPRGGALPASTHLALAAPGGVSLGRPEPLRVEARDAHHLRVRVGAVAEGTRLFASSSARDVDPTPATAVPDPLAAALGASHVILAVPALLEPCRRLAAHRTRTGTPSVAIPVTAVYEAYGHGEHVPEAIRAFLLARMEHEEPPLAYVLLAGDATFDRTDMVPFVTIPAPAARTMYNGATAADRLYALPPDGSEVGGPAIGRLPFRDAADARAYVERLIRYETAPPRDPTRRLLRFVTSEARFGPLVDGLLERMFRSVVSREIPPAYDVEITFASPSSPYLWPPPDLNEKVVRGFEEGCLFYTYVGHGFAGGFDTLRVGDERHPIFHRSDAEGLACGGTPPVTIVVACTTAIFDLPSAEGVGEVLLRQPEGPIAYWGATRICHPAANTLLGRSIARRMARTGRGTRLGDLLDRARDEVLAPTEPDPEAALIRFGIQFLARGADPDRLAREGAWMYALLGDPALRVAFPRADLEPVAQQHPGGGLVARLQAPLPDGTAVRFLLEEPRDRVPQGLEAVTDPAQPAAFDAIRANHARANDLAVAAGEGVMADGEASARLHLPEDRAAAGLVLKAWAVTEEDVHHGARRLGEGPQPDPGER